MKELQEKADTLTVPEFILEIIKATNYYGYLEEEFEDEYEDKIQNVMELIDLSHEFLSIEEMLEQTSLDRKEDEGDNSKVQLLTMHMSKGLEYPVVFLIGCNEGTSPHMNSLGSAKAIQEERRLFYVGMTRAKKILILTRAMLTMHQGGGWMKTKKSPFLDEINPIYLYDYNSKKKNKK
jgi:DNA helicase-2/ATP-dependent DNA helicase PcrA